MLRALATIIRAADARVWQLALGETIVWASLYYLFPALLLRWERGEGWSKTDLSLAFTLALVVSAVSAPLMGRLIDKGYGRQVLTFSALGGGFLLVGLAFTQSLTAFMTLWCALGVAMAGCLYEPCFAFLTHARPRGAKRAITFVTLAAGFASTIAFPVANGLAQSFGWRVSVLSFAVLVICVAAPLLWLGSASRRGQAPTAKAAPKANASKTVFHRPAFWLLSCAFSMAGLSHGMLISHLLPLLDERGVGVGMAVMVASLIGPMQVFGRVAMMTFDHRVSVLFVAALSYVFMAMAATSLYVSGALAVGLMIFAMLQGSGYGVTSITKPLVTVRVMGRANFGAISGAIAVPYMMSYAFAPSLAALLWRVGGYDFVVMLAIVLPTAGLGMFWAVASITERKK